MILTSVEVSSLNEYLLHKRRLLSGTSTHPSQPEWYSACIILLGGANHFWIDFLPTCKPLQSVSSYKDYTLASPIRGPFQVMSAIVLTPAQAQLEARISHSPDFFNLCLQCHIIVNQFFLQSNYFKDTYLRIGWIGCPSPPNLTTGIPHQSARGRPIYSIKTKCCGMLNAALLLTMFQPMSKIHRREQLPWFSVDGSEEFMVS